MSIVRWFNILFEYNLHVVTDSLIFIILNMKHNSKQDNNNYSVLASLVMSIAMLKILYTPSIFINIAKKSILRDKREFWQVLEAVEKLVPEAGEITMSVREMPHIKYVLLLKCLILSMYCY